MVGLSARWIRHILPFGAPRPTLVLLLGLILVVSILWMPSATMAGQAASGELFFHPCDGCHPVTKAGGTGRLSRTLPIKFEGHKVGLEGHEGLGKGKAACQACHDDAAKNPGMLKLADGSLVDIKGDIAQVCYRCHSAKYKEWKAGTHGRNLPKCTAGGCHDPHTPAWIYAEPMLPFAGSGIQFKAVSEREPFLPLAPPAPPPAVETPRWFALMALFGVVIAGGQTARLVRGRRKR